MAVDPLTTFEGFSVSHAAILDGSTGAEHVDGDIYGVREASLELDTDSYDNTGDDAVLSSWYWFNFATLTVQGGYVPFKLISLLTGTSITSSSSAGGLHYSVPLWDEAGLNTPTRPVLIRVPSKNANGAVRNLDFVLYKVQFEPFNFDGPSYKDGLLLNYSGKALVSSVDEKGATLVGGGKAVGRLVNKPVPE